MIGIYQDQFKDFLSKNLGEPIKINKNNAIARCPFCERGKTKRHYHFYISLELPIYHCFRCEKKGNVKKLFELLLGYSQYDKYVDDTKISKTQKYAYEDNQFIRQRQSLLLPDLKESVFAYKMFYLKKRLKFSNIDYKSIKGLIFDINEFLNINKIPADESKRKLLYYLNANFIGFLTENENVLLLRNVDEKSDFRYYKLQLNESPFLDYYKISTGNINSDRIVLAEGIFDIFSEFIFDYSGTRYDSNFYACCLSTNYESLIKSLVYHGGRFQWDVIILSDKGIGLDYYKMIKKKNAHLIKKMTIIYNRIQKDFGESLVSPERIII